MSLPVYVLILVCLTMMAAPALAAEPPLDAARVAAVAAMLPEHPAAPGRPASDRAAWDQLATQPAYHDLVKHAETLSTQALPEQPDDLFLEFTRNGNRDHWQKVANERRGRLTPLVLGECLEHKGRFVPAIEQLVDALCAERTWVMPAHDGKLENFKGTTIDIDLGSSALAWNLAMADYLIGDELRAPSRQMLRDNLQRRIYDPYHAMITGQRPANWWLSGTNNWNAVCLAGVTGAALAEIESRQERAAYVVAAEKYSRNFLAGFTPDGYCSEGLGYWNYGFGHYVLLAETIRQATGGQVDLLAVPEARMPATFAARIQIINGIAPAFADCPVFAKPAASIMYFLNRRFGMGLHEYPTLDPRSTLGSLSEAMIYGSPVAAPPTVAAANPGPGLRDWFDQAGILIGRPAPNSTCQIGVALKGGNNAENHNHNDIGSYVVVSGERPVLLDPGSETYTARTFSSHRYDSKLLNSFGHDVPIVAKTLQREGKQAQARMLKTDFTPDADTLQFDITSAYPVPDLKSLRRTFVYSRQGTGALTVSDQIALRNPQPFGTALITLGSWQKQPDGSLVITDVDDAVTVEIDTGGREYTLDAEEIHENAPVTPTRIGINLKHPVTDASITVKITPVAGESAAGGGLLHNGGFEFGSRNWELPKDGMGAISTEQAASGKASLKITDHDRTAGSNISSSRIPATGGAKYALRGKEFPVAGNGVGLYVRYLNAQRELLNPTVGAAGNIAPVGTLSGAPGHWSDFSFPFQTPLGTTGLQLWIHSYNGSEVEAYLDDLDIVPAP